DKSGRPARLPLLPSETLRPVLHRHSALYYILERQWYRLQNGLGWTRSYSEYVRARFGDPDSIGSRQASAELEKFVAICREQQIPLGIVLFPALSTAPAPQYPYGFLHDRVLT